MKVNIRTAIPGPRSLELTKRLDKSGNNFDGTVNGALLENKV